MSHSNSSNFSQTLTNILAVQYLEFLKHFLEIFLIFSPPCFPISRCQGKRLLLPQKWSEHCFESCYDTATCSQEALPWNLKHLHDNKCMFPPTFCQTVQSSVFKLLGLWWLIWPDIWKQFEGLEPRLWVVTVGVLAPKMIGSNTFSDSTFLVVKVRKLLTTAISTTITPHNKLEIHRKNVVKFPYLGIARLVKLGTN